jgi:TolA-binding protein
MRKVLSVASYALRFTRQLLHNEKMSISLASKNTVYYIHTSFLFLACCLLVIAMPSHLSSQDNTGSTATEARLQSGEEKLYQQCKRSYADGKFADASQYIEKFFSLYPESEHAGEMLLMQAFLQPAIDASTEMYRLIIEKYPNSKWAAKAHFQLGQCYYLQGEYDKALDYYGKVIISYPEDETYWSARYWKCRSLMAKGDCEEAIAALRSLENNSSSEDISKDIILLSLGDCYFGMRDYEPAAASYRSLIELVPHSQRVPSAYLLLAKSLQNLGRPEEAKTFYQKVIEDYRQSIEAQQAQQYLDSLPLTQPKRVEARSAVPQTVGATHASPVQAAAYYSIQVGAFSVKRNAENLASRLRKKGYSVNIVRPMPGKSRLYKVRIGEFRTRAAALKAAQRLRKNEKLDTAVVGQ